MDRCTFYFLCSALLFNFTQTSTSFNASLSILLFMKFFCNKILLSWKQFSNNLFWETIPLVHFCNSYFSHTRPSVVISNSSLLVYFLLVNLSPFLQVVSILLTFSRNSFFFRSHFLLSIFSDLSNAFYQWSYLAMTLLNFHIPTGSRTQVPLIRPTIYLWGMRASVFNPDPKL